jgi:hypothetical protein
MADAFLGLQITSAPADAAAAALDRFVAAAGRAERSVDRLAAVDRESAAALSGLARELAANTAAVGALQARIGGLAAAQTDLGASALRAAAGEASLARAQAEANTSASALATTDDRLDRVLTSLTSTIEANTAALRAGAAATTSAAANNNTLADSARRAVAAEDALAAAVRRVKAAEDTLRNAPPPRGAPAGAGAAGAAGWAGLSAMGRANAEVIATNRTLIAGMQAAGKAADETSGKIRRVGLAAHEAKMIAIQAPDIAQGVFGGQSIAQIGLQQGGQIIQSLQMGEGGLLGGLSRAAVSFGRLFTIGRVAFAGIAGGIALAAYELAKFQAGQDRLTDSLQLRGRASGLSTGGLNSIAVAGAQAGGISTGAGRGLAATYAGAGLRAPEIQGLIGDTKAFARITGESLSDAGENLAKMFQKPVEGAKQLAEAFGGVDNATLDMITHLGAAGRTAEAQAALFKVLDNRLHEVKDTTWTAKLIFDQFVVSIENAADRAAGAAQRILAPSLEEQLAKARATANAPGGFLSIFTGPTTEQRAAAAQRADDLSNQIDRRDMILQRQAARDQAAITSRQAGEVIGGAVPEQGRLRDLQDQIAKLKDGLSGGGGLGPAADFAKEALARLEGAERSLTDAQGKVLTDADLATERFNIETAAINARTLAEKQAVAQMQVESQMHGARIGQIERETAVRREAALVAARAAKEARDQLRGAQDTAAAAGMLPYQRAQQDITTRFRELRVAGGPSAELDAAERLERFAAAQTAIAVPIRDANMAVNAQIRLLEVQRDTFGETTDKVEAAGEKAKLWNSFIAAGVDPAKAMVDAHTSLAQAIDAEAQKYGEAQLAAERLAQAQGEVRQAVSDVEGAFGDLIDVLANDIISGKSKNIGKDLLRTLGADALKSGLASLKAQFNLIVEKPLTSFLGNLSGANKVAVPDKVSTALGARGATAANPVFVSVVPGGGLLGGGGNTGLGLGPGAGVGAVTGAPIPPIAGVAQTYYNGGGPGTAFKGATALGGGTLNDLIANPKGFWAGQGAAGGLSLAAAAQAIKNIESSGGNYGALGKLTKSGDRAYGAYQVMGANVPSWTEKYAGGRMTPTQFLTDKAAQDAVFQGEFGRLSAKYGPVGAARAWFSGEGGMNNLSAQDINKMSVRGYAGIFQRDYAKLSGQGVAVAAAPGAFPTPADLAALRRPQAGGNPVLVDGGPLAVGTPFGVAPRAAAAPVIDPAPIDKAAVSLTKVATASTQLATAAQPVPPALNAGADAFSNLGSSLGSIGGIIGGKSGNSALGSGIGSILGMVLGLFKFADGGVMGPRGRMPLRHYAEGGIASTPQVAIFAEGSQPEAYIPLKGGGVPVKFTAAPEGLARRSGPASVRAERSTVGQMNITHELKMAIDLSGANGDAAIEEAARKGARDGAAMAYARVFRDLPRRLQASATEGRARY